MNLYTETDTGCHCPALMASSVQLAMVPHTTADAQSTGLGNSMCISSLDSNRRHDLATSAEAVPVIQMNCSRPPTCLQRAVETRSPSPH
jgi:hypothetical protein